MHTGPLGSPSATTLTGSLGATTTPRRRRSPTATSNFGVGRREAHDARAFYARFEAPQLSQDDTVLPPQPVAEPFVCGDARRMDRVADGSVALVVTSPPYFAGKQYEEELGRDGIPGSYLEYLQLLEAVFAECVRTLEPGGRIAVNVANLGRKPYRSLAADVTTILQDRLRLLLRGEVVWQKGEGATGSCAWGSYRSASNPVLRDLTERVVVASKGRFSRAKSVAQRQRLGLPHRSTVNADDFMAGTLDVWNIPPESARRVNHPAPFPVELPERLIDLYTFADDLVLDPFMGSGSTLVAAARLGRRYVGYDLDPDYVELARRRVAEIAAPGIPGTAGTAGRTERGGTGPRSGRAGSGGPLVPAAAPEEEDFQARVAREGRAASGVAEGLLAEAGFEVTARDRRVRRTGVVMPFVAVDATGGQWCFDVGGSFTSHRGGLLKAEAVWRALGRALVLSRAGVAPLVLLTSHLPRRPSEGDTALRAAGPGAVFDVVPMLSPDGLDRLRHYAKGGQDVAPLPGYWTAKELERI